MSSQFPVRGSRSDAKDVLFSSQKLHGHADADADANSPASLIHSSYRRTALEVSVLKAMSEESLGLSSREKKIKSSARLLNKLVNVCLKKEAELQDKPLGGLSQKLILVMPLPKETTPKQLERREISEDSRLFQLS